MTIKYNFKSIFKTKEEKKQLKKKQENFISKDSTEAELEKVWPNLRIVKCCGNCKHYWYRKRHERRGYCKLPNPQEKNKGQLTIKIKEKDLITNWPKRHITNVCDNHELKPISRSIKKVCKWTELNFDEEGNLIYDRHIKTNSETSG